MSLRHPVPRLPHPQLTSQVDGCVSNQDTVDFGSNVCCAHTNRWANCADIAPGLHIFGDTYLETLAHIFGDTHI